MSSKIEEIFFFKERDYLNIFTDKMEGASKDEEWKLQERKSTHRAS